MMKSERERGRGVWQVLLLGSMVLMLGLLFDTEPGPTVAATVAVVAFGLVFLTLRAQRERGK